MTRPPVVVAWGAGVDSTAMIVELAERGEPIDMVLFADPGSEKAGTYAFLPLFRRWMADRGIPSEIVRYQPRNFKHWPSYATIAENMLTNATLPSVVFNRGSCSQKWKASAQDVWTANWEPARRCWDAGGRIVKLIGYDASARDTQRYHHAVGCEDPRYEYRYPLREWAWAREHCEERIVAAGLPLPPKSSCFFCGSIKPDEVTELSADELRIIVLMEARAKPRLRNVDGLWRRPVLGRRGAVPRPGSITEFIRERGPADRDRPDHRDGADRAPRVPGGAGRPSGRRTHPDGTLDRCLQSRGRRAAPGDDPCLTRSSNASRSKEPGSSRTTCFAPNDAGLPVPMTPRASARITALLIPKTFDRAPSRSKQLRSSRRTGGAGRRSDGA